MKWLLDIIAAILKIVANKTDPDALKRKDAQDKKKAGQEAVEAVRDKNIDKVNAILHKKLYLVLIGSLLFTGCTTLQPVYIQESDKVFPVTIEGKSGWFVPDPVFERIMQKIGEM